MASGWGGTESVDVLGTVWGRGRGRVREGRECTWWAGVFGAAWGGRVLRTSERTRRHQQQPAPSVKTLRVTSRRRDAADEGTKLFPALDCSPRSTRPHSGAAAWTTDV